MRARRPSATAGAGGGAFSGAAGISFRATSVVAGAGFRDVGTPGLAAAGLGTPRFNFGGPPSSSGSEGAGVCMVVAGRLSSGGSGDPEAGAGDAVCVGD